MTNEAVEVMHLVSTGMDPTGDVHQNCNGTRDTEFCDRYWLAWALLGG